MQLCPIGRENLKDVAYSLRVRGGLVLIGDPHYCTIPPDRLSGEFRLHLFHSPQIEVKKRWLQGGAEPQEAKDRDRLYRLFERPGSGSDPEVEEAHDFFQVLPVGKKYLLEIGPETGSGFDLKWSKARAIYVPPSVWPDAAFTHLLGWMTELWNKQRPWPSGPKPHRFTRRQVERMTSYALGDLRDGRVLEHNIQAGLDADILLGLGPRS